MKTTNSKTKTAEQEARKNRMEILSVMNDNPTAATIGHKAMGTGKANIRRARLAIEQTDGSKRRNKTKSRKKVVPSMEMS